MVIRPEYLTPHVAALAPVATETGAAIGAAALLGLTTLTWGTFSAGSNLFIPVLQQIEPSDAVALSFDDGPNTEFTPRLLDVLGQYQAKASFFLIGRYVAKASALVRRIVEEGHTIGHHTWDHHRDGILGSRAYWRQQLFLGEQAIFDATGRRPRFFRPPMGFKTATQASVVRQCGYEVVGWRLRAFDTLPISADTIAGRICAHVRPRDIVTMHDGLEPQRLGQSQLRTCQAVATILEHLRRQGLTGVSLETGLRRSAYR